MHVREIPRQVFDQLAEGREAEEHDLHALLYRDARRRDLDIMHYGQMVRTCDMSNGVWLRLADWVNTTSLEVFMADEAPVDTADPSPSVFETRKRFGRLVAGSFPMRMSNDIEEKIFIDTEAREAGLSYPLTGAHLHALRMIHAQPIMAEVSRRALELLMSGAYETSRFDRDEIELHE